jgi:hypothetical protein
MNNNNKFFGSFTAFVKPLRVKVSRQGKHRNHQRLGSPSSVCVSEAEESLVLIQPQQLRSANISLPYTYECLCNFSTKGGKLTLMHVLRLTAAELRDERKRRVLPQTEFHVPFFHSMEVLVIKGSGSLSMPQCNYVLQDRNIHMDH